MWASILLEVGYLNLKETESHCFLSASHVSKTDNEGTDGDDKDVDENVAKDDGKEDEDNNKMMKINDVEEEEDG